LTYTVEILKELARQSRDERVRFRAAESLVKKIRRLEREGMCLEAVEVVVHIAPTLVEQGKANYAEEWLRAVQFAIPYSQSLLQLEWARTVVDATEHHQFGPLIVSDAFDILTKLAKRTKDEDIRGAAFKTIEQAASRLPSSAHGPFYGDREVKRKAMDALEGLAWAEDRALRKKARKTLERLRSQ
jgi:hypothetical protein